MIRNIFNSCNSTEMLRDAHGREKQEATISTICDLKQQLSTVWYLLFVLRLSGLTRFGLLGVGSSGTSSGFVFFCSFPGSIKVKHEN